MHDPTLPLRERSGSAVRASRTDAGWRQAWRGLAIAAVVGAFLAFTGAFGSGDAPWLTRFAFWLIVMLAGGVLGEVVSSQVIRRGWLEENLWLQGALMTVLIAVTFVIVPWTLTQVMFAGRFGVKDIVWFLPPVFVVTAVMVALNLLTERQPLTTHAAPPQPGAEVASAPAHVRFFERLPPKLRGSELYAVEAEDHYLRLHTSQGSDLILLRLADAITELEGVEGSQTHRSWWVARSAVRSAERAEGRATLTLPGDVRAPVSRTYVKALREAGWF